MKFPQLRSLKFAPLGLIFVVVSINLTGLFFSKAYAPIAATRTEFSLPGDIPSSGDSKLDLIIFRAGERYGVDPRFIHAVIWQESKYQRRAQSHAGAQGYMQLIPATARRFGCKDPFDPEQNIVAGTKYLFWLLKRFDGNVELALAGYNAGEGAVDKYDGIPPYNETRNYVRIISKRYGKSYHPVLPPALAAKEFHLRPEVTEVTAQ